VRTLDMTRAIEEEQTIEQHTQPPG
jgi:hypothetical protein